MKKDNSYLDLREVQVSEYRLALLKAMRLLYDNNLIDEADEIMDGVIEGVSMLMVDAYGIEIKDFISEYFIGNLIPITEKTAQNIIEEDCLVPSPSSEDRYTCPETDRTIISKRASDNRYIWHVNF